MARGLALREIKRRREIVNGKVCLWDRLWATSPSAQSPVGPSPFGLGPVLQAIKVRDMEYKSLKDNRVDY